MRPQNLVYDKNEVVICNAPVITSVAFYYGDWVCFLITSETDYMELRKRMFALHRIERFEEIADDLYACVISGTDGRLYRMHFTTEAVYHNINIVSNAMDIQLIS